MKRRINDKFAFFLSLACLALFFDFYKHWHNLEEFCRGHEGTLAKHRHMIVKTVTLFYNH